MAARAYDRWRGRGALDRPTYEPVVVTRPTVVLEDDVITLD